MMRLCTELCREAIMQKIQELSIRARRSVAGGSMRSRAVIGMVWAEEGRVASVPMMEGNSMTDEIEVQLAKAINHP